MWGECLEHRLDLDKNSIAPPSPSYNQVLNFTRIAEKVQAKTVNDYWHIEISSIEVDELAAGQN